MDEIMPQTKQKLTETSWSRSSSWLQIPRRYEVMLWGHHWSRYFLDFQASTKGKADLVA